MEKTIEEDNFRNLIENNNFLILDLTNELKTYHDLHSNSKLIIPNLTDEKSNLISSGFEHIQLIDTRISTINKISTYIKNFNLNNKRLNYIGIYDSLIGQLTLLNEKTDNILNRLRSLNLSINQIRLGLLDNKTSDLKKQFDSIRVINSSLASDIFSLTDDYRYFKEQLQVLKSEENEYIERFKEETALLVKEFENKISNLTEKFEHKIKNFELDQDKVIKSSKLLSDGVDAGLKSLAVLNERTQNIELEFSKILGAETENIKTDLNTSKIVLMGVIDTITTEANTKLNEINTAHADFKNIVEQAGIYELTKNYKDKADEEKIEYKDFRKYTAWSIMAAIGSTLLIFLIAFLEHFYSAGNEPTNYLLLASRLSISVMFFVLAFYLSKQAAKHYECYQENHRTFLQLAALEPFMARMTPDEQKEIRKGLIPSYFNQSADGKFAAKGDEVDLPTSMHAIVNRLIDVVAEKKEPKPAETPAAAVETKP